MLRAIIFDMDGVICDSEPLHMKAFQEVLAAEGLGVTDQQYYERYLCHDDRGSIEAAFQDQGRPLEPARLKQLLIRKAQAFDRLMKDHLVIYPGAEALVRRANERYPLALASGARRLEVEHVLKKARIRDCFTAVVSADEVKAGKPRPEAFERALEILNARRLDGTAPIRPEEVLVIEDSPRCIRTAKALGMKTAGVTTSYPADEMREADRLLHSLVGVDLADLEALCA